MAPPQYASHATKNVDLHIRLFLVPGWRECPMAGVYHQSPISPVDVCARGLNMLSIVCVHLRIWAATNVQDSVRWINGLCLMDRVTKAGAHTLA